MSVRSREQCRPYLIFSTYEIVLWIIFETIIFMREKSSIVPSSPMTSIPKGLHVFCPLCKKEHHLPAGNSREYCLDLMQRLERDKRLDYLSPDPGDPIYSTSTLFGEARGKMFGVLEGLDENGKIVILYGFSGQFNGCWTIPGWVAPLFDVNLWHSLTYDTEKMIKQLGRKMEMCAANTAQFANLKQRRKKMSQELMVSIHSLYHLGNFRNQTSPLPPFFPGSRGVPNGTGDCCGPKLLHHAQRHNIIPLSVSEFYWGKENRSGTKEHGHFYPACSDKCRPVMGFMLCGLDEKRKKI